MVSRPFFCFGESMAGNEQQIFLEADVTNKKLTGREWAVTIIGPKTPGHLIKSGGREYVLSANGRLYSVDALAGSAELWEGVKVYDNHLTNEEYERRQGMRSPNTEWLGSIVNVTFDKATRSLRGVFKVVEEKLAGKLKSAWEQGVLNSIGLSIDTFTELGDEVEHEGHRLPVVESFKKIVSVDLVGEPAAGGGFNRIMAAQSNQTENNNMAEQEETQFVTKSELQDVVSQALSDALAAQAEETEVDDLTDEQVEEALSDRKITEAEKELVKLRRQAEAEQKKTALARTELAVERKLEKAHLPDKFEEAVRAQFAGRVVESDVIDAAIAAQREAYASLDPSGRVKAGKLLNDMQVGVNQDDRIELGFLRSIMGSSAFRSLESAEDESVKEILLANKAWQSWKNAGKPTLPRTNGMSNMLWEWFGGNPLLDERAYEAATTSSLSTIVKNTVNIIAANRYSQKELWYERVARIEEVDTIDETTLARTFGVNTLSTVPEGAAYTELDLADEEETASFVKRGNYIGVTLETLMRDKINEIRNIPEKLANAWYTTQSDLVSNVFTVNSATGPVLSDTGALFNATATTTAGGHANLLTTALSHAAYGAARLAMRKQTDQPLGAGRRLLINPRYLLVPADLEQTAWEIRNSELYPGADMDSADSGAQTKNFFNSANQFDVIVVPQWTDATDWALVADPMQNPSIWIIYPRGQRTPQIFSADSETGGSMFTNDTLRFKVRLMTYRFSSLYDAAPVSDFRGLHKSNVAG